MIGIDIFKFRKHFRETWNGRFRMGTAIGFENGLRASRICGPDGDIDQSAFEVGQFDLLSPWSRALDHAETVGMLAVQESDLRAVVRDDISGFSLSTHESSIDSSLGQGRCGILRGLFFV